MLRRKSKKIYEDYVILRRRVNLDTLNFRLLEPKDKIYAAIVTSYQRTSSYRNAQEARLIKSTTEKYELMKDGITYIAEFLKAKYNDSTPESVQLILRPNMTFLIPLLTNYFPEWDIEVFHSQQDVSLLTPMPSIVRFTKKVIA